MATVENKKRGSHIKRQARRTNGRLVSTYSNVQLYSLVRKAAYKAQPGEPSKLSVRGFDRTIGSLGYPDAPSARAICSRLKKGWPDIVESALEPQRAKKRDSVSDEAPWLTDRHIYFALNTVASFENVDTMSASDYDAWLAKYLASRPRVEHILGDGALFPTSNQILRLAAALPAKGAKTLWDRALIFAGLQPVERNPSKALSTKEAINLYIEASGCQFYPSKNELPRLRKEFGISIREMERGRLWTEVLKETLDERAKAGLPVPTMIAARPSKVDLALPAGFKGPAKQTVRGGWKSRPEDDLADALIAYVTHCSDQDPPIKPTQAHYKSWIVGNRDFPSTDVLRERRSWAEWMRQVDELLMERKKAA